MSSPTYPHACTQSAILADEDSASGECSTIHVKDHVVDLRSLYGGLRHLLLTLFGEELYTKGCEVSRRIWFGGYNFLKLRAEIGGDLGAPIHIEL